MGAQNSAPLFTAAMEVTQEYWKDESNRRGIPNTGLEVIIDDNMLLVFLISLIIKYLEIWR